MSAPLILTRDPRLQEELLRLAAAAGVTPEVTGDPPAAMRTWATAPVALVGVDLARELVELGPPRRHGLHLVAAGRVPDLVFRLALELGAEAVVELPRSESWLIELLADCGEPPAQGRVVGVLGGSGGSGATTFACALGLAAGRLSPACLVDADAQGPGVDRVLGFEKVDGIHWDALEHTTGRLGARALRDALPRRKGLGVLTWGSGPRGSLQAFAARSALEAAARGHDIVVVDLPRAGGPVVDELMVRCHHLVVVARGTVAGLVSAARTVARAQQGGEVRVLLRGPGPEPREVARLVGAPVLACMPDQRGLDESVDLGLGPVRSRRGVLARTADDVLARVTRPGARAGAAA